MECRRIDGAATDVVADRKQFGHWECDLIQFRKELRKANVTSLVERAHWPTSFKAVRETSSTNSSFELATSIQNFMQNSASASTIDAKSFAEHSSFGRMAGRSIAYLPANRTQTGVPIS
jgi:IS30 family transposase